MCHLRKSETVCKNTSAKHKDDVICYVCLGVVKCR